MADTITITILDDGTLKTETDKVSNANHRSADSFLKATAADLGGKTTKKAKHGHHGHTHSQGNTAHQH